MYNLPFSLIQSLLVAISFFHLSFIHFKGIYLNYRRVNQVAEFFLLSPKLRKICRAIFPRKFPLKCLMKFPLKSLMKECVGKTQRPYISHGHFGMESVPDPFLGKWPFRAFVQNTSRHF